MLVLDQRGCVCVWMACEGWQGVQLSVPVLPDQDRASRNCLKWQRDWNQITEVLGIKLEWIKELAVPWTTCILSGTAVELIVRTSHAYPRKKSGLVNCHYWQSSKPVKPLKEKQKLFFLQSFSTFFSILLWFCCEKHVCWKSSKFWQIQT